MKRIKTLLAFSRPHTMIGSVISIVTLYFIICVNDKTAHLPLLMIALAIGITCNLFIVGINQVADVHIDKINKPYLPIPSGSLSIRNARIITWAAAIVSLALAMLISHYLFYTIFLSCAIGWAYSMPPLYLKKHHITAALSISIVRGLLINVGGFMVFNYIVNKTTVLPSEVKILTAFIMVFSIVIAWFKDLPDIKGDSMHNIRTFAIVYSPKATFLTGNLLVVLVYLVTIFLMYSRLDTGTGFSQRAGILFFGHILLLLIFIVNFFSVDLISHRSVKSFYWRFWMFFFAEYMLYLLAYIPCKR